MCCYRSNIYRCKTEIKSKSFSNPFNKLTCQEREGYKMGEEEEEEEEDKYPTKR
jgi:hypothetical protein